MIDIVKVHFVHWHVFCLGERIGYIDRDSKAFVSMMGGYPIYIGRSFEDAKASFNTALDIMKSNM